MKFLSSIFLGTAASAVLTMLLQKPANATLQICNRTALPLYTAVGYYTDEGLWSSGWYILAAGQCKVVLRSNGRPKYSEHSIHAHSQYREIELRGARPICTTSTSFKILNSSPKFGWQKCPGKYEDSIPFNITNSGVFTYTINPPKR